MLNIVMITCLLSSYQSLVQKLLIDDKCLKENEE